MYKVLTRIMHLNEKVIHSKNQKKRQKSWMTLDEALSKNLNVAGESESYKYDFVQIYAEAARTQKEKSSTVKY